MKKLNRAILMILICGLLFAVMSSCGKKTLQEEGNVINYGYTLLDGDELYYSKVIINEDDDKYSGLYKYNIKTGEDKLIYHVPADEESELFAFINIVDNEIICFSNFLHESTYETVQNIYKIKKDGSSATGIFESDISCTIMQIVDNTIYYYDDVESMIYKINTNGTGKKQICETYMTSMIVANDRIYFTDDEFIFEVKTSGGEPTIVYDATEDDYYIDKLTYYNNYIYYLDDNWNAIYRVKTSGSNNQSELIYELSENLNAYIESFTVYKGVVYFVLDEYGSNRSYVVMSIAPGTKSTKLVVEDKYNFADISPLTIWNDKIYFFGMPSEETIFEGESVDYLWYSVPITGGEVIPFQFFNVFDDNFNLEREDDGSYEEDTDIAEEDADMAE